MITLLHRIMVKVNYYNSGQIITDLFCSMNINMHVDSHFVLCV